ncbi:hypothetical protein [Sphingopyxis sp. PET50]|uniref:hypothetical protein n=1 Tax=Sphingopyxis sp. PET50 TaxID=2976533 RepID=UPI0021B01CAC|nr:hypothetical protein [Sphingopyxis sp. PET50]
MRAIEAAVPPQPWYPDGYYDVRIAAEAEMADAPDAGKKLLRDPPETPQQGFRLRIDTYRIDNCSPRKLDPDLGDPITQHYAASALEVARLRSVFGRMQFSPAIYADSLLKFERRLLSRDA